MSSSGLLDTNNPLYLHPSDNPSSNLVNELFDGVGFQSWKRSVKIALFACNKLGLINGDVPKPSLEYGNFRTWERVNDMGPSMKRPRVLGQLEHGLYVLQTCNTLINLGITLSNRYRGEQIGFSETLGKEFDGAEGLGAKYFT